MRITPRCAHIIPFSSTQEIKQFPILVSIHLCIMRLLAPQSVNHRMCRRQCHRVHYTIETFTGQTLTAKAVQEVTNHMMEYETSLAHRRASVLDRPMMHDEVSVMRLYGYTTLTTWYHVCSENIISACAISR